MRLALALCSFLLVPACAGHTSGLATSESDALVQDINETVRDLHVHHGLTVNSGPQIFSDELKASAMAAGLWGLYAKDQIPIIRRKLALVQIKARRVLELWQGSLVRVPIEATADMVRIHRNSTLYMISIDKYLAP